MIKYYPYKSDKPNKKYYIITNDNKKEFILARLLHLILHYIKMSRSNNYILTGTRIKLWSRWLLWNLPTITALLGVFKNLIYNYLI
jgi:hypothetical protein